MRYFTILILILTIAISGCQKKQKTTTGIPEITAAADTSANGLVIQEIKIGDGKEAKTGRRVKVHYTGWLLDGKQFDSSISRGRPFAITLGQGSVIPGWEQGIPGMKVGGKRRLTIPSHLAYGEKGIGKRIPPNATLVFDVELVKVY